jgi:hypothetical protein
MVGVPVSDDPVYSIQSLPSYPNRIIQNQQEPRYLLLDYSGSILSQYGVTGFRNPSIPVLCRVQGLSLYAVHGSIPMLQEGHSELCVSQPR